MRFHPDVFAVRSANGFRDTIEDSPAGGRRIFAASCNDSFYSRMHAACDRECARMHCPHKSVNQTSLTRRYWCLAATAGVELVLASCKQAPLFSTGAQRQADESGQLREYVRFTRPVPSRVRDSIILKAEFWPTARFE